MQELPLDWYEEHDGQRLVLDQKKVLAEINRLEAEIEDLRQQIPAPPPE